MTTELKIILDPVTLREATSQAIMGFLTPEIRQELLSKVIANLLKPSPNSWDRGNSPVEIAFNDAVMVLARECARKVIDESPDICAKLTDLAKRTAEKILSADTDQLAEKMADAFVASIRKDY